MKRITWWPQAWLGLVFSWGALVGWPAVTGTFAGRLLLLWFGSIAWVIGYDTLYAIQDVEDDAWSGSNRPPAGSATRRRSGSRSSMWPPRCCGERRSGRSGPTGWRSLTLVPAALHLADQALRADPEDGELALTLFRSNRGCGLLVFLAMLVVGLSAR